jgi:hypothetical protein
METRSLCFADKHVGIEGLLISTALLCRTEFQNTSPFFFSLSFAGLKRLSRWNHLDVQKECRSFLKTMMMQR